ncbi:hypothetical protein CEXT_565161 [Caerostris extrusa]|uniref:Uncharacterized protein n=1 Tax=Caerostris extrusa TaxID=172846 RepID=A0AAV4X8G5_CAEEX|nr:hypothetical protein CEXT_565161 [Caerostris extrusa]
MKGKLHIAAFCTATEHWKEKLEELKKHAWHKFESYSPDFYACLTTKISLMAEAQKRKMVLGEQADILADKALMFYVTVLQYQYSFMLRKKKEVPVEEFYVSSFTINGTSRYN